MPVTMIGTATATTTTNKITTTETTMMVKTMSNATTNIWHALSSKGKKATDNKKLLITAANTDPTILSPMMKTLPSKKSTALTTMIKISSPKQDNVPEIIISVLANVVTKWYKYLRALIDWGSSSSIICKSSMPDPVRKKIKDDPPGKTNGQPREELMLPQEKQTFGSNLLNLPPVACSNTSSKLTVTLRAHPMASSLDVMQWKNSILIFSTVKMYLRSNSSKKLKLIARLVASGHVGAFTRYTFKLNSCRCTISAVGPNIVLSCD